MTESGFPETGFPLADLGICADCSWAFRASDGRCPRCASTLGWMLLPKRFIDGNEKGPAGTEPTDEKGA